MPHRGHHFAERCSVCDAEAGYHCLRCSTIFCYAHAPHDRRRCEACEGDYRERLAELSRSGGSMVSPLLLLTTGVGTVIAIATGAIAAAVGVASLGVLASAGIAVGERRDRANPRLQSTRHEVRELREAFLAERSRLISPGDG